MMALDPHHWDPIDLHEVVRIFQPLGVRWWIAGGWALDLHLGRQTREHEDMDVGILRLDHLAVQEQLVGEWQLFKTKQPGLAPWPAGEVLPTEVNDVWIRRGEGAPWAFQLAIVETEGGEWVYHRLPSIRRPLEETLLQTEDGIPYLRPEIQLLYKGGSRARRPKDFADLQRMLPALTESEFGWLHAALKRQCPDGHEWVAYLEEAAEGRILARAGRGSPRVRPAGPMHP